MWRNLTGQVRNIAEVTKRWPRAICRRMITVDVKGEILELKSTINTMVDQLNAFSGEVTRVAREVGTEGKLGGQAQVLVAGTWKGPHRQRENLMAANLTNQVPALRRSSPRSRTADLIAQRSFEAKGDRGARDTINEMIGHPRDFRRPGHHVARRRWHRRQSWGVRPGPRAGGIVGPDQNVNQLAAT